MKFSSDSLETGERISKSSKRVAAETIYETFAVANSDYSKSGYSIRQVRINESHKMSATTEIKLFSCKK